jgi:superfamily II DNA or RNA helicase
MTDELTLTVTADCRLQGYSAQLLHELKNKLTIDNPKYKDAKKYGRWIGKRLKPKLYFYTLAGDSIHFPRGFVNGAIALCKEYMGQPPTIIDKRQLLPDFDFTFAGTLRPYQARAVRDVLRHHFGVLVAGTGSGKTVMALAVIAARKQPTLVLLHSKELMYQWRDRIQEFMQMEAGLAGDGHYEIRPLTVAIVNTARRRISDLPRHFGHIVVDECHRVPASLFTDVVTAFDCQYTLGLSATAYRREDGLTKLIYLYMGDRIHEVDTRQLTATGAVLKPEFIQRQTDFSYTFRGDYQALMTALTQDPARNQLIADDIAAAARRAQGTILVVSDRVAHCETLAGLLQEEEIDLQVLTGRLGADERAKIVQSVRQGEIQVLISTLQLVGEGFDVAGLTTLFLTTPIKFSGRLRQVIGRILRPAAGKQPRVIDYIDQRVGVLRTSARARMKTYHELTVFET